MTEPLLRMENISKTYGPVVALRDVSIALNAGEIRAIVGENGAGKSTLMKVLSGAVRASSGRVIVGELDLTYASPSRILAEGVAVIYQEFAQAPHLSIAENIALGSLPTTSFGIVDTAKMHRVAHDALLALGYDLDTSRRVAELSVADRQIVEIARAVARDARIIVLDEPSAVLGDAEIGALFALMRRLSDERNVSFLYVSHRLDEVFKICDSVTVLRDGRHIETDSVANFTRDRLISQMVGRELTDLYPARADRAIGAVVLETRDLSLAGVLSEINVTVRRGEIVGICGLAGAGRSEVLLAIAGANPKDGGDILIDGDIAGIDAPRVGIAHGIGLIPEDRKTQGLCLNQSVGFNVMLSAFGKFVRHGVVDLAREHDDVAGKIARLRVKTHSQASRIGNLSGGNQQKCLLARQIVAGSRILLIDEPTRGVDVGARREIYDLLAELARDEGLAVLMVSSELPEVLGLCDRIYVMREGRIAAELAGNTANEETIMAHAAN